LSRLPPPLKPIALGAGPSILVALPDGHGGTREKVPRGRFGRGFAGKSRSFGAGAMPPRVLNLSRHLDENRVAIRAFHPLGQQETNRNRVKPLLTRVHPRGGGRTDASCIHASRAIERRGIGKNVAWLAPFGVPTWALRVRYHKQRAVEVHRPNSVVVEHDRTACTSDSRALNASRGLPETDRRKVLRAGGGAGTLSGYAHIPSANRQI